MVPSSRTPLRPDRLRALNLPSAVEVGIDEWGRPTWVVESDGESAGGRADNTGGPADRRTDVNAVLGDCEAGGVQKTGVPGDGVGIGPPVRQRGAVGECGTARGDGRRVEEVVETWIVQDEWWRAPINRRYVEVVLEGGAHVLLFEDLTTGDWFLQKP